VTKLQLSVIDIKIIKALQNDARMNLTELAKELGVSKNTVSLRLENLKKAGVVTGSLVQVDLTKFGYKCISNLGIKAIPSKLKEVIEYINTLEGVGLVEKTFGSYNIFVWLFLKEINELQKFVDLIKRNPNVIEVKASIWTNTEKALARPENIALKTCEG